MTVAELKELLEDLPDELEVYIYDGEMRPAELSQGLNLENQEILLIR